MACAEGSVTVISQQELERIKRELRPRELPQSHHEKERLKKLSEDRATHWPNTIEALRARKEQARKDKLEQEEAERCKMDVIEAARRAEARRQQIERANKMLHDEIDRVKNFHSKMLLSDVLKEREIQIEYRSMLTDLKKKEEAQFVEVRKKKLKEMEEAEKRAAEERHQRALAQKETQLKQLEEMKRRIMKERDEDHEEGLRIRRNAELAAEEAKQKDAARRRRAVEANVETLKANDALKVYKEQEKEKEREEMRRIAAYASMIEKREMERKVNEEAKAKEKAENLARMLAKQEQVLREAREKAEARLRQQEKEHDEREDTKERDMAERRRRDWEAIDRSRKLQLYNKHRSREAMKEEEREHVEQWKARAMEAKEEAEREQQRLFAKERRIANSHLRTMMKKMNDKEMERENEVQEYQQSMVELAEDEAAFQEYAEACIDEWASQGKTVKPMELTLARAQNRLTATGPIWSP